MTRRCTLFSCKTCKTISMHYIDDGFCYFTERNGTYGKIALKAISFPREVNIYTEQT